MGSGAYGGGSCTLEIRPCGSINTYNQEWLLNCKIGPEAKEQLLKKLREEWRGCANVLKKKPKEAGRLMQIVEGASTIYFSDPGPKNVYGGEYDHKLEAVITGDSFANHFLSIKIEWEYCEMDMDGGYSD